MATKKKTAKKKAAPATKKTAKKVSAKRVPAKKVSAKKSAKKVAKKTSKPHGHPIVHWEIQSQNPANLQRFYAEAFGWKIDANNSMNYGMVASAGKGGINGGIGGTEGPGSRVTVYAAVPDISAVLERIASLGGRTLMPRTDIGPVIMALYGDPEGNVMGLIEG
jgi:predicted enzyme related to lactoylglutathione lyase